MEHTETKLDYIIENQRLREINEALLLALEAIHKRATPRSQDFLHPAKQFAADVAQLARAAILAAKGETDPKREDAWNTDEARRRLAAKGD